jgi:hypothetical protein
MASHRAKVTGSVRKSIVALNQYAQELSQENAALAAEYAHYESVLDEIRRREAAQQPLTEQMLQPIHELHAHATRDLNAVRELKHRNRALARQIAQLESELAIHVPLAAEVEDKTNYLLTVLQHYQSIFSDLTTPPDLPYPYVCRDDVGWTIANSEKTDLPETYLNTCRQIARYSDDFDGLSLQAKHEVMALLKRLREHCLEIIREIKRIDLEVEEKFKHDCQIRKCLKHYALVSLSMGKIRFG